MNALTNGATITVISNNKSYHTLDDWGFAIGNNDNIGHPEQETNYIYVPAMDGFLDLSESLSGRPIYKNREITIKLGGLRDPMNWDAIISKIRNDINGRRVKVTFDNDPAYFWQGRITLRDFDRFRSLGTCLLVLDAEPYKYEQLDSAEPWLWDPFNFETGVIHSYGERQITGSGTITIPSGTMPVTPDIVVANKTSTNFTVTFNNVTYSLVVGSNYIPDIVINDEEEHTLTFTGTAKVSIVYRGGSL